MENFDLKIIKKKYGERMAHLCRDLFPTILESQGELSRIFLESFYPSKYLFDDLNESNQIENFKNYIFSKFFVREKDEEILVEDPVTLMKKAGYILKECHTEEEIQEYKKYYRPSEALCTFNGRRLDRCRVFFAVKENVDEIKRENFQCPRRQDEYGTSVISIQFSDDEIHMLSIKNRYNHTVNNPDSTFSNDLDNIISGLTESFAKYYGLKQQIHQNGLDIPGYTIDNTGKFYKYNYEINNIYYCPNNIIIANGSVKKLDPGKYILIDYFILDLVNKKINMYDSSTYDSFIQEIRNINKIEIKNYNGEKVITIISDNNNLIVIRLDKYNRIIEYSNPGIIKIDSPFLYHNKVLEKIDIPNAIKIGDNAFWYKKLASISISNNAISIGDRAFFNNKLKNVTIPKGVMSIEEGVFSNNLLVSVTIPDGVRSIGAFAFYNNPLTSVTIPNSVINIGAGAFDDGVILKVDKPNEDNLLINNGGNNEKVKSKKYR